MLTKKQNLLETIKGGHPDRFVNQYEFVETPYVDPFNATNPYPFTLGEETVDYWGVTWRWPEGTPGALPVHGEHSVIKDIKNWRQTVKAPPLVYDQTLWDTAKAEYAKFDHEDIFVGPMMFPGFFELLHCFMGMEEALTAFYQYPEEVKGIIDFCLEWECAYLQQVAKHLAPDVVFHHDDWGSERSTLISPKMFEEFFLEPYKKLYGCYRENGFELIIHHSDSYAATLVPYMIEMGIDIWQGATKSNDLPALIRKYGGKISFMAGIDQTVVDEPNWTKAKIAKEVRWACESCGKHYLIPCQTQGAPFSIYDGVYDAISEEIDAMTREMF